MALAGCDLGGTTTRVAVRVDGSDTLMRFPTRVRNRTDVAHHLTRTLTETAHRAGIDVADIVGLGIGMPGTIGNDRTTVRLASNLGIGNEPLDLRRALNEHFAGAVIVENDVKTAAFGLMAGLPDAETSTLTYLSVGTGIASATVVNGNVLRGAHGSAGEIGQIQIEPSGAVVAGSVPGSLEAMAAGPVMEGDPVTATTRVTRATRYLARAVHTLFMVFDPDHFVIGGGAVTHECFSRSLVNHINELRSSSSVTASIIDPTRITFLDANATPGVEGALMLVSQPTQVSNQLGWSASDKGAKL